MCPSCYGQQYKSSVLRSTWQTGINEDFRRGARKDLTIAQQEENYIRNLNDVDARFLCRRCTTRIPVANELLESYSKNTNIICVNYTFVKNETIARELKINLMNKIMQKIKI